MINRFLIACAAVLLHILLANTPATATPSDSLPANEGKWWLKEPIRLLQTNLRDFDVNADPADLIRQVRHYHGNTLMVNMGGFVAFYPTTLEYHIRSRYMRDGRDFFGSLLDEAHRQNVRVIGRFDFSKLDESVYLRHPDWFFRNIKGEPHSQHGIYTPCVNGDYYQQHALDILTEALETYPVDGLFFNMLNNYLNPVKGHDGKPLGPCHCENCKRIYNAEFSEPLPLQEDDRYKKFIQERSYAVVRRISELIRKKNPGALMMAYTKDYVDAPASESQSYISHDLPLYPYYTSENVNRSLHMSPGTIPMNLSIGFIDYSYRFTATYASELQSRLYQSMAHGGVPAFVVAGTFGQHDRTGLKAIKPVYEWHERHGKYYVGQKNAARVLVLADREARFNTGPAMRGLIKLLTELHIPFVISDQTDWVKRSRDSFDLVIGVSGIVPADIEDYVTSGGRLLMVGAEELNLKNFPKPVGTIANTTGAYFKINDHKMFPSLKDVDAFFVSGKLLEYPEQSPAISFRRPLSNAFVAEKVGIDTTETSIPGVVLHNTGKGTAAHLPWDLSAIYYRYSHPTYQAVLGDIINYLLPEGRQLLTDAHPMVEMAVMRQGKEDNTLLHLINLSGQNPTAVTTPITMSDIEVRLKGEFRSAKELATGKRLRVARQGEYSVIRLKRLYAYSVVLLK